MRWFYFGNSALCIMGAFLVAFGNGLGFVLWIFGNGLWVFDNLKKHQYEESVMWSVFTLTAIIGTILWLSG